MASNTPKSMSNRLMTMKFMQRSAAKAVSSEPSTPNGPPAKKVRLSSDASTTLTPYTPADREMMQSALAEEEKKREEASARAFERSGETKWVLSFQDAHAGKRQPAMRVRQAGFAVIDADNGSDDEEEDRPIRMQYGGGLKKKQVKPPTPVKTEGSASDGETDSSSSEDDSDDPTAELIRETRREVSAKERSARKAQDAAAQTPRRPAAPMDEDMDLAGLTSLSGAGRPGSGARGMSNMECYRCGEKGHIKQNCTNQSTPRGPVGRPTPRGSAGRGGRGRGRGRR